MNYTYILYSMRTKDAITITTQRQSQFESRKISQWPIECIWKKNTTLSFVSSFPPAAFSSNNTPSARSACWSSFMYIYMRSIQLTAGASPLRIGLRHFGRRTTSSQEAVLCVCVCDPDQSPYPYYMDAAALWELWRQCIYAQSELPGIISIITRASPHCRPTFVCV